MLENNFLKKEYHPRFKKNNYLRKILQLILMPFGFYVVDKIEYENKTLNRWDMNLTHIFKYLSKYFNKDLLIFDVGSHKGELLYFFKQLFPTSRVYCFEPQLNIFKTLIKFIKTKKYKNVVCENIGLDKFDGTKCFYSLNNTTQSTFLKVKDHKEKIKNTTDCKVVKGDNYCILKNIDSIDILKINVQGLELDVIMGFEKYLSTSSIKLVLVEFDYSNRYEKKTTIGNLETFLSKYNYNLFDISLLRRKKIKDSNNNEWFLKVRHGYAVFVNEIICLKVEKDL